jgi:hypothetical protein
MAAARILPRRETLSRQIGALSICRGVVTASTHACRFQISQALQRSNGRRTQ